MKKNEGGLCIRTFTYNHWVSTHDTEDGPMDPNIPPTAIKPYPF